MDSSFNLSAEDSSIPDIKVDKSIFSVVHSGIPWEITSDIDLVSDLQITDRMISLNGVYEITREWTNKGTDTIGPLTLGTCIPLPCGQDSKITIPHQIYNGNPSADPNRLVPRLPNENGYTLLVEEHRLPIPGINVEWEVDGRICSFTIITDPCAVEETFSTETNDWWTLGIRRSETGVEILSLSGAVCFNNVPETVYGGQNQALPMRSGYVTLKPGDTLRKRLWIKYEEINHRGHGFRSLVSSAFEVLKPVSSPLFSIEKTIELKTHALISRYRDTGKAHGFSFVPDSIKEGNVYSAKPGFMGGWVGQNLKLAWCALELARSQNNPELKDMAIKTIQTWVNAPFMPGTNALRYHYYDYTEDEWYADEGRSKEQISTRMVGENLMDFSECISLMRSQNLDVPSEWITALEGAMNFLCDPARLTSLGVFPLAFGPGGEPRGDIIAAGGAPCVAAIISAANVVDDEKAKMTGLEILGRYYELFAGNFDKPFARSTLDAACEDKEAGIYFFLAAWKAWKVTGEKKYAEWALISAEWISTFVYMWNTPMRPGTTCKENDFKSVFWPGVSVQNQHLDVFFPAWEIYELGKDLDDCMLQTIGRGVMDAWSHGIAQYPGHWDFPTPGEQGEQFNHTNYYQGPFTREDWRGNMNKWNPSWIIALVLQAALKFSRLKTIN